MMKRIIRNILAALLAITLAPAAQASAEEETLAGVQTSAAGAIAPDASNWSLGIGLGYGLRSNPLIQSDDIPIFVDLDIAWFGEHWFFDNGDLGLTVSDNARFTLNLVGRVNSDRVFFGRTDTRIVQVGAGTGNVVNVEVTVPDRDYAIEAGAELLASGRWGLLQFSAFHDVSGTHEGFSIAADYSYGFRQQRWYLEPSLRIGFKSSRLNDYYWGVRPDESNLVLPAYAADSGINVGFRLLGSYQLTREWAITAVVEYERLNDETAGSPIVDEDHVLGYFGGFAYRF
jgi:outer membrane protein